MAGPSSPTTANDESRLSGKGNSGPCGDIPVDSNSRIKKEGTEREKLEGALTGAENSDTTNGVFPTPSIDSSKEGYKHECKNSNQTGIDQAFALGCNRSERF